MPATDDPIGSAQPTGHPERAETAQYGLSCLTPLTTRKPAVV
jgi:hypothetical protein